MATDQEKLLEILRAAQSAGAINDPYKESVKRAISGAPRGTQAPSSWSGAQQEGYGSYNDEGKFVPYRNDEVAALAGYYGQDAADAIGARDRANLGIGVTHLDSKASAGLAKEYGLQGMADDQFSGLTASQARAKAQQIKEGKLGQISANTSYGYDPGTVAGFRDTMKDLQLKLDANSYEPFVPQSAKNSQNEALIKSYSDQLAGMFQTPEDFNAATQNPDMMKALRQYEQIGGSISDITSRIGSDVVGDQAVLSPYGQPQDTADYISQLDAPLGAIDTVAEQRAFDALIPEKKVYQAQIAQQYGIAEQHMEAYFGTPDQVGFVEQREALAEERMKLIDKEAKMQEKNMRAQANFATEKAKFQMEKEAATVEKNRLAAKNYLVGTLAKMGALKTTGAAPVAIAKLEQKYQEQAQNLRTEYDLFNRNIEIQLNENLNKIEIDRDDAILSIKEDLSKSEEDIWKEIFKLQNDADKFALATIQTYTQEHRVLTETYRKEAKADAEKYAKEFASSITDKDMMESFPQFLTRRGEEDLQTKDPMSNLPDYLQSKIDKGKLSATLESILMGNQDYASLTGTEKQKINNELTKLRIPKEMITGLSEEADQYGEISADDEKKAVNYIYNNSDDPEGDIEKLKTDREFQAYILSNL